VYPDYKQRGKQARTSPYANPPSAQRNCCLASSPADLSAAGWRWRNTPHEPKMVVDTAIVRQVFEGMLPVVFTLSPKDLVTMKQPDPIYVLCPSSPIE